MVKEKEAFEANMLRVLDILTVIAAYIGSYFISDFLRDFFRLGKMAFAIEPTWSGLLFFTRNNAVWVVLVLPICIALLGKFGIYENFRMKRFRRTTFIIIEVCALSFFALGSIVFMLKAEMTSRFFLGLFSIVTTLFLVISKRLAIKFSRMSYRKGYNQINILIVGTGHRARSFIRAIQAHEYWGFNIIGLIDDDHSMYGKLVEGYRVIGRIQDVPQILHWKVIDRVIFVVPRLWLHRLDEVIMACEREGIPTSISLDLYNLQIAKPRQTFLENFPLLEFTTFSASEWQLFVKRVFDIVVSSFALLLMSPLLLITGIAIKLNSNGPVFFTQTRCGLNGRKFMLYKFRSMFMNSDMKKKELARANEMDGPVFKMKRDPRVTPVGRFIRKFSIDELPQLLNILKGDMSVVGPRPPLPAEVELYEYWQRRRLSLRPGLTCIWQVSGRNKISFKKWMEMDLRYIDNWSLWLDLKLFVKTFFVVIFGYGAS